MRNRQRLLTILLVGMSVAACTTHLPYRTSAEIVRCAVDETLPGAQCEGRASPDRQRRHGAALGQAPVAVDAAAHSIQHRSYKAYSKTLGDMAEGKKEDLSYYLSFVEFDDQGWFADRQQMEALFGLLGDLEQGGKETLVYVYAHGWKHNASACDSNVVCFSRFLERIDALEHYLRQENARTVVGVYLGWRGLPSKTGPLTNVSFWSRKEAAARVGRGGVFELLVRLNDYRNSRQGDETDPNKTQLVITGHSFGGLVIYSALSHALMERAAKTTRAGSNGAAKYDVAKSFGDFVMLVNPAFEGSQYEPLFHIATNRCYDDGAQRPVMMIVTSEDDSATGKAFPMGRTLGTLFQHTNSEEQKRSLRQAIGHDDRYLTHNLTTPPMDVLSPALASASEATEIKGAKPATTSFDAEDTGDDKDRKCQCPDLEATAKWDVDKLGKIIDALLDLGGTETQADSYGAEVLLKPVLSPQYAASYPYLVIRTDGKVIADHNAIYSESFINFAQLFLVFHIAKDFELPERDLTEALEDDDRSSKDQCWREDASGATSGALLPREQSCQLDGKPCTWQAPRG